MIIDIPYNTERRQSPRYQIPLAIELVLGNDMILDATASNISKNGLKVICDSWAADEIEPRGLQNIQSKLHLKVIMTLDTKKRSKKIYSNCRVISTQRISQDEYTLSLAFIDFENGTAAILDNFLNNHQEQSKMATTA